MNFKFSYPDPKQLAGELKAVRENYKLTNNYIAEQIGTSAAIVSKWLTFKSTISPKYRTIVEDFIARTWQPALVFITPFDAFPHGIFLNVGDKFDPFYTWLHDSLNDSEAFEEYNKTLVECERAVKQGIARVLIVETFKDLDEANKLGRREEKLYMFGLINPEMTIHWLEKDTITDYRAKTFDYENTRKA